MRVKVLPGAFMQSVLSLFGHNGFELTDEKPEIVVWTGGADVNPKLYGQEPIAETYFHTATDNRDVLEYHKLPHDIPKIGICRGAQLLNVLAGGKLWQDCDHHQSAHQATDLTTGSTFQVTSIHHQMMRPTASARLLLVSKRSSFVKDQFEIKKRADEDYDDIEALYHRDINALCYQGHPEVAPPNEREYFLGLVHKQLEGTL